MTDQQMAIDALRAKAQQYRDQADQIDALADLNAEVLAAGPNLISAAAFAAVTAPKQKTAVPTPRKKGGAKTKNGQARQRSAPFKRMTTAEQRAEVMTILGALAEDEWFTPVAEAKDRARVGSSAYRYYRGYLQRQAKALAVEGLAEERTGTIEGKHGKRRGGVVLQYRLKK